MNASNGNQSRKGISPLAGVFVLFAILAPASAYIYYRMEGDKEKKSPTSEVTEVKAGSTHTEQPIDESTEPSSAENIPTAPSESQKEYAKLKQREASQETPSQTAGGDELKPLAAGLTTNLWYRVKKGESLSKILTRFGVCDDYRTVTCKKIEAETLDLNTRVAQNRELRFNEKIFLPIKRLPAKATQAGYTVGKNLEITLNSNLAETEQEASKRSPASQQIGSHTVAPNATSVDVAQQESPSYPGHDKSIENLESSYFESYSLLELVPDFRYYRIDGKESSNGSKAILISSFSPGLYINWKHIWSPELRTWFGLGFSSAEIQSSRSLTIRDAKQTLTGFKVGAEYDFSRNFHSLLTLATQEEFFYWAPAASVLEIQKTPIPRLSLGGRYDYYHRQSLLLFVGLDGTFLMPAKHELHDIRAGYGYSLLLGVLQKRKVGSKISQLKSEAFYEDQNQNSSLIDRSEKIFGLRFILDWDFWR